MNLAGNTSLCKKYLSLAQTYVRREGAKKIRQEKGHLRIDLQHKSDTLGLFRLLRLSPKWCVTKFFPENRVDAGNFP